MNELVNGTSAMSLDNVMLGSESLDNQVSVMEQRAASVLIINDEGAKEAAKMIKQLKDMVKRVNEYWRPAIDSAYSTHKQLTNKRKAMLDPLQSAEKILKNKIDLYVADKDRKERERQEQMRLLAQQEVDKRLSEAAEAEQAGDSVSADYAMYQAEIAESIASQETKGAQIDGANMSWTWEIDELDPTQVPITVCGVTVHVGDKRIVERIVKEVISESFGKIEIPGVKYHESYNIKIKK